MAKWVKPTEDTRFHIDFDWWEAEDRDFRVHLLTHLCEECQGRYADYKEAKVIDWIDANTAEVTRVDGLWHALRICCSTKPDYINQLTPLATAIFRTFLANGNEPLSSVELGAQLGRPPGRILRTIGGFRVYNGIKPVTGKGGRRTQATKKMAGG
jgi:hypothetical protein